MMTGRMNNYCKHIHFSNKHLCPTGGKVLRANKNNNISIPWLHLFEDRLVLPDSV